MNSEAREHRIRREAVEWGLKLSAPDHGLYRMTHIVNGDRITLAVHGKNPHGWTLDEIEKFFAQ